MHQDLIGSHKVRVIFFYAKIKDNAGTSFCGSAFASVTVEAEPSQSKTDPGFNSRAGTNPQSLTKKRWGAVVVRLWPVVERKQQCLVHIVPMDTGHPS